MKEKHTAAAREFIYSIIWALVLLFIGRGIINSLSAYKIIGAFITLIMFSVLGFFVLTRYSSVFTYENTGSSLRVNRTIGKRSKEIEFGFQDIITINSDKPANMPRPAYYMRTSVFSGAKSTYIIFGCKGHTQTLIFEPSEKFMKELKKSMKGGSK